VVDRAGTHIGMVVARSVGGAVVRNKVRRRLRGVVMESVSTLPDGVDIVVRALPPAAGATYDQLHADFESAVPAAVAKGMGRTKQPSSGSSGVRA
jgi:ribonuclease P protein component